MPLIQLPRTEITPSLTAGYAQSANASAYPELWRGMGAAVAPVVGVHGHDGTAPSLWCFAQRSQMNATDGNFAIVDGGIDLAANIDTTNVYTSDWEIPDGLGDGFTVAALMRANANSRANNYGVQIADSNADFAILLGADAGEELMAAARGGSQYKPGIAIDDRFHGVAATVDASSVVDVWHEGESVAGGAAGGSHAITGARFRLFGPTGSANFAFPGTIRIALAWDRVLTPAELALITTDPYAPFRMRPLSVPTASGGGSGVAVSPSAITAVAAIVAPSVTKGSISIAPTAIDAVAVVASPAVGTGSVTVSPTAIESVAVVVDPTVSAGGDLSVSPSAITAVAAIVAPSVTKGSISITPTAIDAVAVVVDPVFDIVVSSLLATATAETYLFTAPTIVAPPIAAPATVEVLPTLMPLPKKALRDFLVSDRSTGNTKRDLAREKLMAVVTAKAIHNFDRIPQGGSNLAVTLSNAGGQPFLPLDGAPFSLRDPSIDISVWGSDRAIPGETDYALNAAIELCHGYRGMLSEEAYAETLVVETEPFDDAIAPSDGSGKWVTRQTVSVRIGLRRPTTLEASTYNAADEGFAGSVLGCIDLSDQSAKWSATGASIASDPYAIGGTAYEINTGQQIAATVNVRAGVHHLFSRHKFDGVDVGDASLHVDQAGQTRQTFTVAAVTPADAYEGLETYRGATGFYRIPAITLVGGNATLTFEGPSSAGDSILIDFVALCESS